jgi:hypothetical protein
MGIIYLTSGSKKNKGDIMKTHNIWHCEDCHKIGFYYGMTDDEIREKHNQECEVKETKERELK